MRYMRSISINSHFTPTPKGVWDIRTLYLISLSCDILQDPILFRAIFLVAFYAFLRMSNIAPHSKAQFDKSRHLLRKDVIFGYPGAHIILKWYKTLQNHKSHHIIQIPVIDNPYLCPVKALHKLLNSRPLPPDAPLFATIYHPHSQILDTPVREALKSILKHRAMPTTGFSFHTFRRSGATFAFNHNVQLQHIMAHGSWRSSAVWEYLQNASQAASIVPLTFSSNIPSSF